MIAEL
jgi:hypothetical protein